MGGIQAYQSHTTLTLNKPGQFNAQDEANFQAGKAKKPAASTAAKDGSKVSAQATSAAAASQTSQGTNSVADKARAADVMNTQGTLLANLGSRMADLASEAANLAGDLKDPGKAAEANARMQLIQMQLGTLSSLSKQVQGIKVPDGADAKTAIAMKNAYGDINNQIANLSDPNKRADTKGKILEDLNVLQNPALAGQNNPAVNNQKTLANNLSNRIDDLIGEMDKLIGDLGDPARANEANARLNLLNQQVSQLVGVQNQVGTYRVKPDTTPAAATKDANLLAGINAQIVALSDPNKADAAQKAITAALAQLGK